MNTRQCGTGVGEKVAIFARATKYINLCECKTVFPENTRRTVTANSHSLASFLHGSCCAKCHGWRYSCVCPPVCVLPWECVWKRIICCFVVEWFTSNHAKCFLHNFLIRRKAFWEIKEQFCLLTFVCTDFKCHVRASKLYRGTSEQFEISRL